MSAKRVLPLCMAFALALLVMMTFMTLGSLRLSESYHLSNVFLNMWQHFILGDLNIDSEVIGAEGFFIRGETKAYFLPFPALIRGFLTVFNAGSSAVISMTIAGALYLLSSSFLYIKLVNDCGFKNSLTRYCSILFLCLLIFSPPILGLLTYPDVFTEAIAWGYALFMLSIYLSIQCVSNVHQTSWLTIYALISGLTLFTRPPYLVASSILLGITLLICHQKRRINKLPISFRKNYVYPLVLFSIMLVILGVFNYTKWGSPFEFYPLQYYKMYSKEDFEYLLSIGTMRLSRVPQALSFYFLPSLDNFTHSIPWLKTGSHNYFDHIGAPVNYREPTYPITITMPWYFLSSILGIAILFLRRNSLSERVASITSHLKPPLFASGVLILPILCLHANAWRYIGEFIPVITLLSILGWIYLLQMIEVKLISRLCMSFGIKALVYGLATLFFAFVVTSSLYFSLAAVLRKDVFWHFWQIDSAYVSQSSPIKPNRMITFDQGLEKKYQIPFLISGWGEPEKNHTWSVGDRSSMQFLLPPAYKLSTMVIQIKALVLPAHPKQVIDVYVNKRLFLQKTIEMPTDSIEIPISIAIDNESTLMERIVNTSLRPNIAQIDFVFKNAISPKELGIGEDERKLAIAVQSVTFR